MKKFLKHLFVTALSLGVTAHFVDGIHISSIPVLIISSFLLNIVITVIKPILTFFTLPFTILTFGLFLLVVNGMTLSITAFFMPGFHIDTFGSAVVGWIVLSLSNLVVGLFVDKDDK